MSLLNKGSSLASLKDGPKTYSPLTSDRLLDVKATAELLNVPESWVYQHVRARTGDKIPHFKLGEYIRFSTKALTDWLETRHFGGKEP